MRRYYAIVILYIHLSIFGFVAVIIKKETYMYVKESCERMSVNKNLNQNNF